MTFGRKSLLAAALVLWTGSVVRADVTTDSVTGYWTGKGADGKWSNGDNWQDGIIPGVYTNSEGVLTGATGCTAVFGAVETGAQTVIDLANQYTVKKVVITNGAPSYCFGAEHAQIQKLAFEADGVLEMAAAVTTSQTVVQAGIWVDSSGNRDLYVNNSSASTLYFGDVCQSPFSAKRNGNCVYIRGTGPVVYNGKVTFDQVSALRYQGSGAYTWSTTGAVGGARFAQVTLGTDPDSVVDLTLTTPLFGLGGSCPWTGQAFFTGKSRIHGPSVIYSLCPYNAPATLSQYFYLYDKSQVTVDTGITTSPNSMSGKDLVLRGWGEMSLNSTNQLKGVLRLLEGVTCGARMIGNKGCTALESSIPLGGSIVFEGLWSGTWSSKPAGWTSIKPDFSSRRAATFKYTGEAAASTDRDIMISNLCSSTQCYVSTNTFANAGGGTFTLNSAMLTADDDTIDGLERIYAKEAAFRFQAETAELDFNGTFPQEGRTWHLFFAGPQTVKMMGEAYPNVTGNLRFESGTAVIAKPSVFANAASWQFAGGALRFTAAETATIAPTVESGASTIVVPSGMTLTLAGFTGTLPSGASINVVVPDDAVVMLPDATPSTWLPGGVTVNGHVAKVSASGQLVARLGVWANAVDGAWTDGSKWSPAMPVAGEDAVIAASGASYTVTVTDGAADGLHGYVISNASEGATATLSGSVFFTNNAELVIGKGGKLASTSGTTAWNSGDRQIRMEGGEIEFGGTATLAFTNRLDDAVLSNNVFFGTGKVTFKDDAELCVVPIANGKAAVSKERIPNLYVTPNAPGETAQLVLSNRIYTTVGRDNVAIYLGYDCPGGTAIADYALDSGVEPQSRLSGIYAAWQVGSVNGTGVLNLRSGNLRISNDGFHAGTPKYASNAAVSEGEFPTGIVNQTGGMWYGGSFKAAYSCMIWGTIIGAAAYVPASSSNRYVGIYNLKDGAYGDGWNAAGMFIVGAGPRAEGYMNISGGTFNYRPYYTHTSATGMDTYTHPLLVGFGGAYGEVNMSGGEGKTTQGIFIGGALLTDVGLTGKSYHADPVYPNASLLSTGVFNLSGGSFTFGKNVYLGANGHGTLTVSGGTLTCSDLVLSNNVDSAVKFTLAADGTAPWTVNVTNDIVITSAAKIIVDARQSAAPKAWTKLAGAHAVRGWFATDNVEILSNEDNAQKLFAAEILPARGSEAGLFLHRRTGMMVIIH